MPVKNLKKYIFDHSNNYILSNTAAMIMVSIQDKPYAEDIFVIDDPIDFSSLEKGYYLRFIERGYGVFHLYAIEVFFKGKLIVHENIPRRQLNTHSDVCYRKQLQELDKQNLILYRIANVQGGGAELHEDLAVHYADTGSVGIYVNNNFGYGSNLPQEFNFPEIDKSMLYPDLINLNKEVISFKKSTKTQAIKPDSQIKGIKNDIIIPNEISLITEKIPSTIKMEINSDVLDQEKHSSSCNNISMMILSGFMAIVGSAGIAIMFTVLSMTILSVTEIVAVSLGTSVILSELGLFAANINKNYHGIKDQTWNRNISLPSPG